MYAAVDSVDVSTVSNFICVTWVDFNIYIVLILYLTWMAVIVKI